MDNCSSMRIILYSVKKLIVLMLFSFIITPIFSQSGQIEVKDLETGLPVFEASLVFTDFLSQKNHYGFTSANGTALNTIKTKSTLQISHIGYESILDTILPKTSKTYHLKKDVFMLNQVVVTATRNKKALKNTPVLTQVITGEQIEARGLQTVDDVLKTDIPSIEFQQHGHGINMGAQGLLATNILLLVDGERMAGETRANVDYNRLNIDEIERIEIVKGASSSLYGSQAMGAVINIITKTSKKPFYGSIGAQLTSNYEINYPKLSSSNDNYIIKKNLDRMNLTQNYTFGFNQGKWEGRTSFIAKSKDAYELTDSSVLYRDYFEIDNVTPETKYIFYNNGLKDYTINQSIGYTVNNKLKITTKGSYYQHDEYDFKSDNIHDFYSDYNYTLKAQYTPNSKSNYSLSINDDVYKKYDFREKLDDKNLDYKHHIVNPKLNGNHQISENNNLASGIEYLYESLSYSDLASKYKTSSNASVFVQEDIQLSENWNTVAGARLDYHTSFGTHFSPKISLMFKKYPFTFRTNYASGYRSPSLKELYQELPIPGILTIKGNENLNPETNQYLSASLEYSKSKINTSVSIYRNAFKDRIDLKWFVNETSAELIYQNLDSSTLLGIDYLLQYQPVNWLNLKASYSYVEELVGDVARISAFSPHTGSLQLGYNYNKKNYKLNATITGKYMSAKDHTSIDEDTTSSHYGEIYTVHYKDYSTWRLSVQQEYKHKLKLTLGVENLFDYTPAMYTFSTTTTSGRSYFVGLKLNVEQFFNN